MVGTPIVLTQEQRTECKRLQAEGSRLAREPALRSNPDVIQRARELIDQAHAAGLPATCYLDLQLAVSAYDTEMAMPPHLRNFARNA